MTNSTVMTSAVYQICINMTLMIEIRFVISETTL